MAVGIYKITSPTNKVYIGQSWWLEKRESAYRNLSSSIRCQRKIYNSLKKYGWAAHKFEILMNVSENVTQQMFDEIEQTYMDYYRKLGFELMNIKEAGAHGKMSEESKKLVSEARKGNPGNRVYTDKHREALRENTKNRVWTPEMRLKVSNTLKGHTVSPETREKISISKTGKKATPEVKELLLTYSKNIREKQMRPVIQFDLDGNFIKEWPSIAEAARTFGVTRGAIINHLRGKNKTALNSIWKYKEETI